MGHPGFEGVDGVEQTPTQRRPARHRGTGGEDDASRRETEADRRSADTGRAARDEVAAQFGRGHGRGPRHQVPVR